MTVQEVVLDLLQYIGVLGFAPLDGENALNRPGLDDRDIEKAVTAVNSALQVIQKFGPQSMKEGERAAFLNAPTYVTVNVDATTAQSIEFVDTPALWIPGCSILVSGDSDLNRIVDVTGNMVSLLRGYRGATANGIQATIYADCASLQDDIVSVLDPVIISPNERIHKARDLDEFLAVTEHWSHQWPAHMHWNTVGVGYGTSKPAGTPRLYWTDRRFDGSIYLRLNPMPVAATNATFRCKLGPQKVSIDDLAIDGGPDPGAEFTELHETQIESVLLPVARGKFLSHPALKNLETRQTIRNEYDSVMLRLENGSAFETSVAKTRAVYI